MTRDQIQAVLRKEYDRQPWLQVMREILPGTDVFASPQTVAVSVPDAPQALQLARVRLGDRKQLAVLEIKVSDRIDLLRNRVGLRNLVTRFIDQAEYHGVLAVFLAPQSDSVSPLPRAWQSSTTKGTLSVVKLPRVATPTFLVRMNPAAPPPSASSICRKRD